MIIMRRGVLQIELYNILNVYYGALILCFLLIYFSAAATIPTIFNSFPAHPLRMKRAPTLAKPPGVDARGLLCRNGRDISLLFLKGAKILRRRRILLVISNARSARDSGLGIASYVQKHIRAEVSFPDIR